MNIKILATHFRELVKVEENISRITLLLNEVSVQLDSLEKEKNDALKYQEHDITQKNSEKSIITRSVHCRTTLERHASNSLKDGSPTIRMVPVWSIAFCADTL